MAVAGRTGWLDDGSGFDEAASRVTLSRHASQLDAESVVSGQRQAHAHSHVQVGFDERSRDTVSVSFACSQRRLEPMRRGWGSYRWSGNDRPRV
jgi:hypothetical protein